MSVELNPPAGYAWTWWAVAAGALALLVVLVLWCCWTLRESRSVLAADSVERLRQETLAELDALRGAWAESPAGTGASRSAAGQMGACVRRFVGIVTDGEADFSTLPRIRRAAAQDSRLNTLVDFLAWLEPKLYTSSDHADVVEVHGRAREVVEQWR